uniref:Uncharacterized protein n=1 Tax=Arundo donax TaxID=35708 RepID=A0A0A9BTY3_ARUDO
MTQTTYQQWHCNEIKLTKLPCKICEFLQPVTLSFIRFICILLTSANFFLLMHRFWYGGFWLGRCTSKTTITQICNFLK